MGLYSELTRLFNLSNLALIFNSWILLALWNKRLFIIYTDNCHILMWVFQGSQAPRGFTRNSRSPETDGTTGKTLLKNGCIVDGTGKTRFTGDVLLGGNKILEVSYHPPNTDSEGIAHGVVDYDTIGCEVSKVTWAVVGIGLRYSKAWMFRTLIPIATGSGQRMWQMTPTVWSLYCWAIISVFWEHRSWPGIFHTVGKNLISQ